MIETIKGTITYATAAIALLGAMAMAYLAWSQPVAADGGRDIAILFGFLGLIVGAVLSFLFGAEAATRTARATERAVAMTPAGGTDLNSLMGYMPHAYEDDLPEEDLVPEGEGDVDPRVPETPGSVAPGGPTS